MLNIHTRSVLLSIFRVASLVALALWQAELFVGSAYIEVFIVLFAR
jgi:hypothetical protein